MASTSRAARFMAFLSVASGAEMSKSGNSGGGTLASSSDALAVAAISGSGTDSEIKTMQQRTRLKSFICYERISRVSSGSFNRSAQFFSAVI